MKACPFATALVTALLACAACSAGAAGPDQPSGPVAMAHGPGAPAASCADLVTIGGTSYIYSGRDGGSAKPLPHNGSEIDAVVPPCGDGNEPSRRVVVHAIPGVRTADAVAGPLHFELMLAERWWRQPREALPAALQPYLRR